MNKIDFKKSVYELTEEFPELIEILYQLGFNPVKNDALRRTVGRWITIPQACKNHGKDINELILILKEKGYEIKE